MNLDELQNRIDKNMPEMRLKDLEKASLWSPMILATMLTAPKKLISSFGIESLKGAVFVGAPGNGKHTAAKALAGSKCNPKIKNYHHFLRITGWDFDCQKPEEACAVADYAAGIAGKYENICILLDNPEESKFCKQFQYRLACNFKDTKTNIFVIVVTTEEKYLCRELTEDFKICRCVPPTKAQREQWIKKNTEDPFIPIENMTNMELAEKTEGFSWKQLDDMLESMRQVLAWRYFDLYKKNNRSDQLLEDFIKTGKAVLTYDEAQQIIDCMKPQNIVPVIAGQVKAAEEKSGKSDKNNTSDKQQTEQDYIRQEAEYHKHPENMSADQLFNI